MAERIASVQSFALTSHGLERTIRSNQTKNKASRWLGAQPGLKAIRGGGRGIRTPGPFGLLFSRQPHSTTLPSLREWQPERTQHSTIWRPVQGFSQASLSRNDAGSSRRIGCSRTHPAPPSRATGRGWGVRPLHGFRNSNCLPDCATARIEKAIDWYCPPSQSGRRSL
jgi:hypothetical protein